MNVRLRLACLVTAAVATVPLLSGCGHYYGYHRHHVVVHHVHHVVVHHHYH